MKNMGILLDIYLIIDGWERMEVSIIGGNYCILGIRTIPWGNP